MSSDLDLGPTLRRLKPEKRRRSLRRRPDDQLAFAEDAPSAGSPLLLDTTVYIDVLHRRAPSAVKRLLRARTCNHSATCIAELAHALGRLDPAHPDTKRARDAIMALIGGMKNHRIQTPGPAVWCEAGVLAGLLFRLGSYGKGQETRCVHDALIYLQARSQGMTVLTRNVADFDLIEQLATGARLLFYQRTEAEAAP